MNLFCRLTILFAAGIFVALPIRADVIFTADFSSLEKAANQWENLSLLIKNKDAVCRDGGMEIKSAGSAEKAYSLKPKVVLPPIFSVEFKATVLERSGKDNHLSLNVDGVTIVIRQWGLTCIKNKEPSTGQYSGIGNNKEHSFLIESNETQIRIYGNGALLHKIDKPQPATPKLIMSFYNVNVLVKDFKIYNYERSKQTITANLLRNSSFETITNNLPDYWGSAHWGITSAPWAYNMDEFRQRWRIDQSTAYDGKNSFRIEATDDPKTNWTLGFYSCWPSLRKDGEYAFSVYLKSDRDDMAVQIGPRMTKGAQTVKVGKEWQRYQVNFKCDKPSTEQLMVIPASKGIVWIDAAQLEENSAPTAYVYHSAEKGESSKVKTPQLEIPQTEKPPVLDGTVDDPVWKKAARGQMVCSLTGKVTQDKTDIYLLRDDYNLYLAVECFDSQMDKLVANVKQDKGPVWKDDDVEIFLKPEEKGNSYYQFGINSLGFKYEGKAFADLAWTAEWQHQVKRGKNSWIVTAAIPFSTLGIESGKSSLGFNVCRSNPKTKEISAWSPTGNSFLKFENWGRLIMSSQVGGIFVSNLQMEKSAMTAGIHDLTARIVNNTAKDINGVLELAIQTADNQKISQRQDIRLKTGSSVPVRFAGLNLPDSQNCRITLNCKAGGSLLLTMSDELETLPVLAVLREFSYFSNEKDLRFAITVNGQQKAEPLNLHYIMWQGEKRVQENTLPIAKGGSKPVIVIPNNFGIGDFRLEVELCDAYRKVLNKTEEKITVLAHLPNEGKINLWRHSILLDGKEIIIWGNLLEFLPDEKLVKLMSEAGFNNLTLMVRSLPAPEQVRAMLDAGTKYGVNFLIWFGSDKSGGTERTIKAVPMFNRQSSFLGFFAVDEACANGVSSARIDEMCQQIRQSIGANSLIFHNENDLGVMQKVNFRNADILAADHYTIPERELDSVSLILERLKKLAGNRATCFIAQSTGNAYSYGREPTPEELVNQVYQSFTCDVWNIMFFANIPLGAENMPMLKRLRGELDKLVAMDVPYTSNAELSCSTKDIKFIGRETATQYVIVAVNLRNNLVAAKFSAPWLKEKQINRLFEDGTITNTNGSFGDSFPSLGRHVYYIDK